MKIIGNTVGTTMPRTNYEQTDSTKADYLKGKEVLDQKIEAAKQAGVDAAGNAQTDVTEHKDDKSNPHGVTAEQVGARPDTWMPNATDVGAAPASHPEDKNNPHGVTAEQVGARPDTWMPTAEQVGAVEMKLLWTNASPGSTFAAQTVSLSLSGYAYVALDYRPLGTSLTKRQFCKVGEACLMDAVSGNSGGGMSGTPYGIWRQAEVKTSGVVFTKAVKREIGNTSASITDDNGYMKPFRIFGIKGVK